MNINREGTSQVAINWNVDWKLSLGFGEMVQQNSQKNSFEKTLQETSEYDLRSVSPSCVIVFMAQEIIILMVAFVPMWLRLN